MLVCDQAYLTILDISVFLIGQLIGGFFLAPLSDHLGRRPVVVFGIIVQVFLDMILLLSINMPMFIITRFFIGAIKQTVETAAYTLLAEWFCTKHRTIVSNASLVSFSIGIMLMATLAMFIQSSWRILLASYYLAPDIILAIPLFFLLPESMIFLESKKKYSEIDNLLEKIGLNPNEVAHANKIDSHPFLGKVEEVDEEEIPKEEEDAEESESLMKSILNIFTNSKMLCLTLALFWLSLTMNFSYFATTMSTVTLHGDDYINFILSGAVEMPFVLITSLVSLKLPRLVIISFLYLLASITLLLMPLLPESGIFSLVMPFFGRGSIAGVYVVQILYATEMFPTVTRNAGLGLYQIGENVGPLLGPSILALKFWNPTGFSSIYFVIGIIAAVNAVISSMMPETFGKKLPETVSDVVQRPALSVWRLIC